MSIEEECQIDFNMVFLRKSTFQAIKSNYENMKEKQKRADLQYKGRWFLKMAKKYREGVEIKNKHKLGIKNRLKKSVSIINIQSIIQRDQ
jgi:hypothetical protein